MCSKGSNGHGRKCASKPCNAGFFTPLPLSERPITWVFITGGYPPQRGGVSDYTYQLAQRLAQRGTVHVFAPHCDIPDVPDSVIVHRLLGRYGPRGLLRLTRELAKLPKTRRTIVQYVTQSFGAKGINFLFAVWLWMFRKMGVWVMFHEVAISPQEAQSFPHRVHARLTELMACIVARSAEVAFVSTETWIPWIKRLSPRAHVVCVPVPSNVEIEVDPADINDARDRLQNGETETLVVGHFGTYREAATRIFLTEIVPKLLAVPGRKMLFLGQNGDTFAQSMAEKFPALASRISGPGATNPKNLAAYISACDILLQPYPDGATTRRTTLVATLALGRPVITSQGSNTEPLWRDSNAVVLVPSGDVDALICAANELLSSDAARTRIGERARQLYQEHFSLTSTVNALLSAPMNNRTL